MQIENNHIKYLPHVDGLRALAVAMVILFHFGLGVPGGFVGVDVFFVISGFLITSIIRSELLQQSFSLARFWERRARRILPALSLVLGIVALAGWYLLLPNDYKQVGQALFAQAFFIQNVVFWKGEGYFSAPAENQPLLHTWSLAVEEQFYLFFPIFLLLIYRYRKSSVVPFLLVAIAICSFILGWIGIHYYPSASFYFLPTRAWELLLGAVIAWLPVWKLAPPGREVLSALGLGMVFASCFVISPQTPFPGYAAMLPVAGTGIFIAANRGETSTMARFLGWKPLVGMGLISYSLYLWHWPVWVFYNYWNIGEVAIYEKIALIGLCFILAVLTWKFIEQPFRRKNGLIGKQVIAVFSISALVLCLSGGFWIAQGKGIPWRFPSEVLASDQASREESYRVELKPQDVRDGKFFQLGVPNQEVEVFVWGDSLAMALLAGIDEILKEREASGLAVAHSATPPLRNFDFEGGIYSLNSETRPFSEAVIYQIKKIKPKHVILAGVWSGYLKFALETGLGADGFEESLRQTLIAIRESGAEVWIIAEPPQHKQHIPKLYSRKILFGIDPVSGMANSTSHKNRIGDVNNIFKTLPSSLVRIIDPVEKLNLSDGQFRYEVDGQPVYRDHVHLSEAGSKYLIPMYRKIFN